MPNGTDDRIEQAYNSNSKPMRRSKRQRSTGSSYLEDGPAKRLRSSTKAKSSSPLAGPSQRRGLPTTMEGWKNPDKPKLVATLRWVFPGGGAQDDIPAGEHTLFRGLNVLEVQVDDQWQYTGIERRRPTEIRVRCDECAVNNKNNCDGNQPCNFCRKTGGDCVWSRANKDTLKNLKRAREGW